MFKKTILGTIALSAVSLLAVACSSGEGGEGEFAVEDGTTGESALGANQRGCPSLVVRRQMLTGGTTTVPVSGVQASIVENGAKLRCGTNATGTFTVGTTVRSDLYMPDPRTKITRRGNNLEFSPALPPQATMQGPANGRIASLSCLFKGSTLEGIGFPSVSLPLTTVWNVQPDPTNSRVRVTCTVTTPNPLALTTARPKDIISTSGDDFIFRCDLTGTARRNACQRACNGNSQCVASCDTNAGCSPILCQGSECPSQTCAPENRCSVSADCGAPGRLTCSNGCCLTIIR
ncbi:MAG TPA: hypothetical protein VJV79_10380 [Polyangiaceae bacterium]|nr:hypothetical protein [Polyangiaceae bacterium]